MRVMNETRQSPATDMPTPEQLVGLQARLLRQARGWSQQEVAQKMQAYGYRWSQATVTRLEAASRPIRVNELADLAILFGVPVAEFLDSGPPADIDAAKREVAGLTKRRAAVTKELELEHNLATAAAQSEAAAAAELARLNANLAILHQRYPDIWENTQEVPGADDDRG